MAHDNGFLKLGKFEIPIESATLTAVVPDPHWCDKHNQGLGKELGWTLEVVTEFDQEGDRPYAPILDAGSLQCPSRNWRDFEGVEVSWAQLKNDRTGEFNGWLNVLRHEYIKRSTIRFLERDQNRFRLAWSGVCDIDWYESEGQDIEFSLETTATFRGASVDGSAEESPETFRNRLDKYIDASDFQQSDLQIREEHPRRGLRRFLPWLFKAPYRSASCSFHPK